ncbi:MAG TPA: hypothetical protein VK578_09180 [Edaphobacter sp.]|nr:hypothetical protein [Edaphobacter sp.]
MKVFDVSPQGSGIRALRMNPQDVLSTDRINAMLIEQGIAAAAANNMTQLVFDAIEELTSAQRHAA